MTKNDAMQIIYGADRMGIEELLAAYAQFHAAVENTPDWLRPIAEGGKSKQWQRALHGSIGLCTESAELLDAFKKELYGKNKPLERSNIIEECGDVFFYLHLVMSAMNTDLHAVLYENVVKLAQRYVEKLG